MGQCGFWYGNKAAYFEWSDTSLKMSRDNKSNFSSQTFLTSRLENVILIEPNPFFNREEYLLTLLTSIDCNGKHL